MSTKWRVGQHVGIFWHRAFGGKNFVATAENFKVGDRVKAVEGCDVQLERYGSFNADYPSVKIGQFSFYKPVPLTVKQIAQFKADKTKLDAERAARSAAESDKWAKIERLGTAGEALLNYAEIELETQRHFRIDSPGLTRFLAERGYTGEFTSKAVRDWLFKLGVEAVKKARAE